MFRTKREMTASLMTALINAIMGSQENKMTSLNEAKTKASSSESKESAPKDVSSQPIKAVFQQNPVEAFHLDASNGQGLVISTCTNPTSGCHDFGKSLAAAYPKLDYAAVKNCSCCPPKICTLSSNASTWKQIFITGCGVESAPRILSYFIGDYRFRGITTIYAILPPHHPQYYESVKQVGNYCPWNWVTLTSQIDCKPHYNIGIPRPLPLLESKYELSANCFGLMYLHPSNFDFANKNPEKYLHAYFSAVARAAGKRNSISVIAIRVLDSCKAKLSSIAKEHGIEVDFTERLPQGDFIQAIKLLQQKNGIIAVDGFQASMQVFYLGAKVLIFNYKLNDAFFQDLINQLPLELQDVASVLLGQSENYKLLEQEQRITEVYQKLHELLINAVKKFEGHRAQSLANVSEPSSKVHELVLHKPQENKANANQVGDNKDVKETKTQSSSSSVSSNLIKEKVFNVPGQGKLTFRLERQKSLFSDQYYILLSLLSEKDGISKTNLMYISDQKDVPLFSSLLDKELVAIFEAFKIGGETEKEFAAIIRDYLPESQRTEIPTTVDAIYKKKLLRFS